MSPFTTTLLAGMAALLLATEARPNGINPPRPASSTLVQVACERAEPAAPVVLKRTQLLSGSGRLDVRTDDGSMALRLMDLRRIDFEPGKTDAHGYLSATLASPKPEPPSRGRIRVVEDGKPITISGFNETGKRVTIALSSCRSIQISSAEDNGTEGRGAAKK